MNEINNRIPSLHQLATQAVLNQLPKDAPLCQDLSDTYRAFCAVKGIWDSYKDQLTKAIGSNCILQNIEKSLIMDYCKTFNVAPSTLAFDAKETLLINNVGILFQRLTQGLNVPMSFNEWPSLQQQWEEEALEIFWNKGICPQLGENPPELTNVGEIRGWMTDPNNAVLLDQITMLNLRELGIKAIPPEIKNLTNLKTLLLYENKIQCIPEFIGGLTGLEHLILDDNLITSIPNSIASCESLTMFQLQKNKLTHIPEAILGLTKIEHLGFSDNSIAFLPNSLLDSLLSLNNLEYLCFSGNPLFLHKNPKDRQNDLSFSDRTKIINFLNAAKSLNDYQCQGSFSQFIKLIQYAIGVECPELIQAAFEKLSDSDKDLICRTFLIFRSDEIYFDHKDGNPLLQDQTKDFILEIACDNNLYSCYEQPHDHPRWKKHPYSHPFWRTGYLFHKMDTFCEIVIQAVAIKYEDLSLDQQTYVTTRLKELGVEDIFSNIILLSDIMAELDNTTNSKEKQ